MPPTEDTGSVRTKEALLQTMATEHRKFMYALKELSPTYMEAPEVVTGWSLKDLLGHMAAWQLEGIRRINLLLQGSQFQRSPLDAFNAEDVSSRKHFSLAEMEAFHRQARHEVQQLLERLTPEQLARPELYNVFEAMGVRHYRQHLEDVLAFRTKTLGAEGG